MASKYFHAISQLENASVGPTKFTCVSHFARSVCETDAHSDVHLSPSQGSDSRVLFGCSNGTGALPPVWVLFSVANSMR